MKAVEAMLIAQSLISRIDGDFANDEDWVICTHFHQKECAISIFKIKDVEDCVKFKVNLDGVEVINASKFTGCIETATELANSYLQRTI